MSKEPDLRYCEYCDTRFDPEADDGECPSCKEHAEREQAYWFAQFGREPKPYTREEVEDCYSEPCEYQKRESMLMEIEK